MPRLPVLPLFLLTGLVPAATFAESTALAYARASMMNSVTDGGMARALAYCVFHAPTYSTILADAAADGMNVSTIAPGSYRILSPADFPGALIQVTPLAGGAASCMAWSASARAGDANGAVDEAAGFYLKGGRIEKLAGTPSDYIYRELPFAARLRAFASQEGHGGILEISGFAPQHTGMLLPVPPEQPATTWPRTQAQAADQGAVYDYEFLFGTGCVVWLPDLTSALIAMQRSQLPMARSADSYAFASDFGGLLQLTEGPPGRIRECMVSNAIPMATANEIVRRTFTDSTMSFNETALGDGTAQWTGTLAPRMPGDEPTSFVAETYFESNQRAVSIRLTMDGMAGQ